MIIIYFFNIVAIPRRGSFSRNSHHSQQTGSDDNDQDDQDEIRDLTDMATLEENSLMTQKDGVLHL